MTGGRPFSFMRRVAAKRSRSVLVLLGALLLAGDVRAAGTATVRVTAVVLSKSVCHFNTKSATLAFGSLDPLNAVDVTKTATITCRCLGSSPLATFAISDDDGLHETGPNGNRMMHTTNPAYFLPYAMTVSPASATVPRLTNQTLLITGTVLGNDYRNAAAGVYSDTVVITIVP